MARFLAHIFFGLVAILLAWLPFCVAAYRAAFFGVRWRDAWRSEWHCWRMACEASIDNAATMP